MSGEGAGDRRAGGLVFLCLLVVIVLTGVDLLMLYLALAFGPSGFGGDRTWTQAELVRSGAGELAGVVALVLAAAAVVVGVAVPARRGRVRAVAALVCAQAFAVAVLIWSITG